MLHHRKQTELWGCLYHSAYALTGEAGLLEHVRDISNPRFYARLHALGLMSMTLYASPDLEPTFPWFWMNQRSHGTPQLLLVSIEGSGIPGVQHAVAVELTPEGATVSDSRLSDPKDYRWDDFLASPYARAYTVEVLAPADLEAYAYQDAEQVLGRALASTGPPRPEYEM